MPTKWSGPLKPTPRAALGDLADVLPGQLLDAYLEGFDQAIVSGGDARKLEPARQLFSDHTEACANAAQAILARLDPTVAFDRDVIPQAVRLLGKPHGLEGPGLNRFSWMIAVAGGGTDRSVTTVGEYLSMVAAWYNSRRGLDSLPEANPDQLPLGVLLNRAREDIRRLNPTTIQFRWVSYAILRAAADEIAADPDRYSPLREVTGDVVDELFAYIYRATLLLPNEPRNVDVTPVPLTAVSPGCQLLLRDMSMPVGSLVGRSFRALLHDRTIETNPLVTYDGAALPMGYRESLIGLEQGFFEVARKRLADKERSDLFERTTSRCLAEWGPPDMAELTPPVSIRVSGQNPGEIDFALVGPQHLLIGECKAYLVTPRSDSVINAFPAQMGKAVDQLNTRSDAFRLGGLVHYSDGSRGAADGLVPIKVAVPLHSYATAIWNADCLSQIEGAIRPDLAIIPLHQLILVAATLRDTAEFAQYLAHRHSLQESHVLCLDESDYLVGFLNPDRTWMARQAQILHMNPKARLMLNGCYVPFDAAVNTPPPVSREEWRKGFYDMADCPPIVRSPSTPTLEAEGRSSWWDRVRRWARAPH